jgi:hypothetical protein
MQAKMSQMNEPESVILVEGPSLCDAEYFGTWLLKAAKANKLWKEVAEDPKFAERASRLQVIYCYDFGRAAVALLLRLQDQFVAFTLPVNSKELEDFAILEEFVMMVKMGFFARTGPRYQIVIPGRLDIGKVRGALIQYYQTLDAEDLLHPEYLVTAMPSADAKAWQTRLLAMDENHRNADRLVLLGP